MFKYNSWVRQKMTGTTGVTNVPLPAFWFSSKNEGDQLRRSPRREHLCQNPRCAANNMAYSILHPEPPMKRIKGSFKNARPNNVCPVSSNGTPTDSDTCGGIKAHGRHGGKYADGTVASSPRSMAKPRRESRSVYSLNGSTGMHPEDSTISSGINPKELTGFCPNDSEKSERINSKESTRLTGINPRESTISPGNNSKESTRLTGIYPKESTRSARLNSKKLATAIGIDSVESTTSISSSSHTPSISTPRRSPPKPSKNVLAPLSVQKESTSTESSSPGCSQGTTRSLRTGRLSESMDSSIADTNLTPSFLRSGRMAPPNSERDEEELPPIKELDWLKPSLILPQFHGLPKGSPSTSRWPPSPASSMDTIAKPIHPAPTNYAPTSINCLPVGSSSISSCPSTLPTDVEPISRPVNMASTNDLPPSNLPAAPLSSFAATVTPEATTTGIRATPMRCASSPPTNKLSEGRSGSCGPSIVEHVKCRRIQAFPKRRETDLSTRSSTIATISNAAQMCILEQRLEDEDHSSNSSNLDTVDSDSPTESCSIEPSSTPRGVKPVSAFYNALYAPDCTLSGTKALEAHLHWQNHSGDRKLRAALEIAILSAMVTILVVVFYPAVTRGLRSHFYGCCSCPTAPATAASRNPSQHYSQLKASDGCAYRGRTFWDCLPEQETRGSAVVK